MRITEAARRLGTSARMLRYREDLGLLPRIRDRPGRATPRGPSHRQFSEEDLEAMAAALALERRYDISPARSPSACACWPNRRSGRPWPTSAGGSAG